MTFSVSSVTQDASGVTTVVVVTSGPSAAGSAEVRLSTSTKQVLFMLDLVAIPAGDPDVLRFSPSSAECSPGTQTPIAMRLGAFRELGDPSRLRVTVGG